METDSTTAPAGATAFTTSDDAATQAAWDAAYTTYQGWSVLHDFDSELGAFARAGWDFDASAKSEADLRTLQSAETVFHKRYGEPAFQAISELLCTPAPTIAAVREKIHLITHWSISDDYLPIPADDLIADDIERLTGVRA